jgi:hypothetical protein
LSSTSARYNICPYGLIAGFGPKGVSRMLVDSKTTPTTETAPTPIMLVPALVEQMLARRQELQVVKFRTTCTDCVPNF